MQEKQHRIGRNIGNSLIWQVQKAKEDSRKFSDVYVCNTVYML